MKSLNFKDIELLSWDNDISIKGVLMEGKDDEVYLVNLPQEKIKGDIIVVSPTSEEWYTLQDQLDKCNILSEEGTILRKGQRNIDNRIAWQVYRRDKFKCRYCGIDNVPLTVDHIITWESGGATHPSNLLSACRKCNKKRGNLDYGSWLQHKHYIAKSFFLPEHTKKANEDIVKILNTLPRMARPRSRQYDRGLSVVFNNPEGLRWILIININYSNVGPS